jgi:hypothetical protein
MEAGLEAGLLAKTRGKRQVRKQAKAQVSPIICTSMNRKGGSLTRGHGLDCLFLKAELLVHCWTQRKSVKYVNNVEHSNL